jgi:flagellar biogenesis protein FliO
VRPTKPLELLEENPHTSVGWKLGALVIIGGLCAWVWKTRTAVKEPTDVPSLRILRRTSIGVRSELLVVEMDGQRLLLGVTPSTIQNLYIAPFTDDAEVLARGPVETVPPPRSIRQDVSHRPSAAKLAAPDVTRRQRADLLEGQALGIRSLVERK